MDALLEWTGHPLIDVGLAALCAMSGREDPSALTLDDLDRAAKEMEEHYFSGVMDSYLSCVFTMNAEYTQPAGGAAKEQRRKAYVDRVLFAHRYSGDRAVAGVSCFVSGRPATHLLDRRQMPMLTGEGVLNFFPAGLGGLPLYGPYVTALQALPLAGRRSEGKLLIAHADDPALMVGLAGRFLKDNRRLLNLAKSGSLPASSAEAEALEREVAAGQGKRGPKYPDAKGPKSLILHDLMELWEQRQGWGDQAPLGSLTVYLLSNSGQGPSLEMWYLPCNLLRFLFWADREPARSAWRTLLRSGWDEAGQRGGPGVSRNRVAEEVVDIYSSGVADLGRAQRFLRSRLFEGIRRQRQDAAAWWELTHVFLSEVLGMDAERIKAIKQFADTLADHIHQSNDRDLLRAVFYAEHARDFRRALVRAQREQARRGHLLFSLDQYVEVFEVEDNLGRLDWPLVRDLIAIRVIEQLHNAGYFTEPENAALLEGGSQQS